LLTNKETAKAVERIRAPRAFARSTRRVRNRSHGHARIFLAIGVRRVLRRDCGQVKRGRLALVANNPFRTKRFAYCVRRRCRQAAMQDMSRELNLDWDTIKTLEKQYIRAHLPRAKLGSCRCASFPGT
jgi:hypothetical protein